MSTRVTSTGKVVPHNTNKGRKLGPSNLWPTKAQRKSECEREALIAAAPDLLDLAKDIAGLDHHYLAQGDKALQQALREWKAAARAAIAKAEGTS